MNNYDSREFMLLGQRVDTSVFWAGGPQPEFITIDGNNINVWAIPQIYNHNTANWVMDVGVKPFSIWKWFQDNISSIDDFDWSTSADEYTRYIWAFDENGLIEEYTGSTRAYFWIALISPTTELSFYFTTYSQSSGEMAVNFDDNIMPWLNGFINVLQENLNYYGFRPSAGLNDNDIWAACCTIATPQQVFTPDITNNTDFTEDSLYILQNGYYSQQNPVVDEDKHNDLFGYMNISGITSMMSNGAISSISRNGVPAQYGGPARIGYYPDIVSGTIGDVKASLYEFVDHRFNFYQYGSIPWNMTAAHLPLGIIDIPSDSDEDVEEAEEEGGEGEYIQDDETQGNQDLPGGTGSGGESGGSGVTGTHMAHLYNPTPTQMKTLVDNYLWDDNFMDNIKKIFVGDPMDSIITLGYVPVDLTPFRGNSVNAVIGTYECSAAPIYPLTTDYIELDFGTITVKEKWGSALDFDPYSTCEIYLPYCGYQTLSMSDILYPTTKATGGMSIATGEIHLYYKINLFTGDCVAQIFAKGTPQISGAIAKQHLIAQFSGNCIEYIPFTGANYANYYKNIAGNVLSGISSIGTIAAGAALGNPLMTVAGATSLASSGMISQPPKVQRSGTMAGGTCRLQYRTPFIRLTRPSQSLALAQPDSEILNQKGYKNLEGVACNFYVDALSDCLGFTAVETVELKGINATDTELEEIRKMLHEGVFIGTGH